MWVEFDEKDGDLILHGDERYFLTRDKNGKQFVATTRCPHRGGPLHFGEYDENTGCIKCPWHNMKTPVRALKGQSLTASRCGSRWHVRLPTLEHPSSVVIMPNPGSDLLSSTK